ncbi:hypothetical protein JZ751_028533, partial [Albula glossodonta]
PILDLCVARSTAQLGFCLPEQTYVLSHCLRQILSSTSELGDDKNWIALKPRPRQITP